MSKEAYNIGREVGEAGRGRNSREGFWRGIRRTVETNCWQNGRVFVQETRARLPFLRRQRFSVPSLRLFAQWPWDCSSRTETPVSRNRFEDPRNQPTTDWLDKVKEKRRNKDGGTAVRAATGRKSGELKRLRLFYLSRRLLFSFMLWLGFRKLITIRVRGLLETESVTRARISSSREKEVLRDHY